MSNNDVLANNAEVTGNCPWNEAERAVVRLTDWLGYQS